MPLLFKTRLQKVLRHKHPVRYTASYFLKWSIATLSLSVPALLDVVPLVIKRNGYRLRIASTPFSVLLYRYPEYFREDEDFIQKYLKEGDIYVDIGANIGTTTLAAAVSVGKRGQVHAIEAHPRTFRNLERSIACNPALVERISTYQYALGNKEGRVAFTDMQQDDINHVSASGNVEVPLARLDEVLEVPTGRIALLKIDVEGYEKFVFEGAGQTLAITDAVYFESYEENFKEYDYTFGVIHDLLTEKGFVIYTLVNNAIEKPVDRTYRSVSLCENLIAIRDQEELDTRVSS